MMNTNSLRSRRACLCIMLNFVLVVAVAVNLFLNSQNLFQIKTGIRRKPLGYEEIEPHKQKYFSFKRNYQKKAAIIRQPKVLPKHHQFLDFDPDFFLTYNLTRKENNSTANERDLPVMVHVGRQGPAVMRAITYGFYQHRIGFARKDFDRISVSSCIANEAQSHMPTAQIPRNVSQAIEKLPQAMLIGVQKGGTTALYKYLDIHPLVMRTKKELYFLDETIDELVLQYGYIPRDIARRRYQKVISEARLPLSQSYQNDSLQISQNELDSNNTTRRMILDLTPHYILESDRIPARISCIVPWVKLFVLFRNPVDRARSQYDMKRNGQKLRHNAFGNLIVNFDEYVQNDINALKETGVIQNWDKVPFDLFWDSPAMWQAWKTYLHSGLNGPVGLGLYAIQLKPFLSLPNELLAIRSEDLQMKTEATFQEVLRFLELPAVDIRFYPRSNRARIKTRILNSTRSAMEDVFRPFNSKLAELLGESWQGVWD